jgi:peroxiredoxin
MTLMSSKRLPFVALGLAAALGAAAVLIPATGSAGAATAGDKAPAFSEASASGQTVSLSDYAGKTVILEWTNDGCPFVQKHYKSGNMQKTQEAATASDDVVWLSVISSKKGAQGHVDAAGANALTKSRGAHPTQVLLDPDGSMGKAYGAKTTPHMYIITPDGKIAYSGAIDSIPSSRDSDIAKATNYVTTALASLKAGKSPSPAVTVPYGCSVKY